jgi:hypothetical protein
VTQPLDILPLWALYPILVVVMAAALVGGHYLARAKQRDKGAASDRGVGSIAGATLGLLALLLAFVVGFGVNVWNERRDLVVSEANAVATTYLRAGYLEEPFKSDSRALLSEYADQRVAALDPDNLAAAKARSEAIHVELWSIVEDLIGSGNKGPTDGLYISSLNEVIDLHTERVNIGLYVRIPPFLVLATLVIALLTLFLVGMQMGYTENRSLIAPILLVLVLSAVVYVIVDIDRARTGLFQVPAQALLDLQAQLPTLP